MLTTEQAQALDAMTVPQLARTAGEAIRWRDLELVSACVLRVQALDPVAAATLQREVERALPVPANRAQRRAAARGASR